MRKKLKSLIEYGGLTYGEYAVISPYIVKSNRHIMMIFSPISIIIFLILSYISIISKTNILPFNMCILGAIVSTVILFITYLSRKWFMLSYAAIHIAASFFLCYGVLISTFIKPNQQATTFIVLLVLLPLIFIDKPKNAIITNIIWSCIFIIGACFRKPPEIRNFDITNVLIFGFLATISSALLTQTKMNEFLLEHKLNIVSTVDKMTGLNNRNCYEWAITSYADKCDKSLCCIYIDINGLHELNNTKGHEAGDKMLKYIAEQVKHIFGKHDTYRIGGDEYVAFVIDTSYKEISEKIKTLQRNVESESYHIAVGSDHQTIDNLNLEKLIKKAEQRMYQNKEEWYKKSGKEHR